MENHSGSTQRFFGRFERRILAVAVFAYAILALMFHDVSGGKWADWFEPKAVLSLLGIVVGFLFLHWQLEKQNENTLRANRKQAADKLRLEIYEKIADRLESTTVPLTRLINSPRFFVMGLRRLDVSGTRPGDIPESSFPKHDFLKVSKDVTDSILPLIAIIEIYEVALSEFGIFKKKLSEQLSFATTEISKISFETLSYVKKDGFGPAKWSPDFSHLDKTVETITGAGIDLMGTVADLRVEALNYLVSPLFHGKKATARRPGDPMVQITSIKSAGASQDEN